jgi:hypothetical protein
MNIGNSKYREIDIYNNIWNKVGYSVSSSTDDSIWKLITNSVLVTRTLYVIVYTDFS